MNRGANLIVSGSMVGLAIILLVLLSIPGRAETRLQTNQGITISVVALNSSTATLVLAAGGNLVSRTVCNSDASIIEYAGKSTVTGASDGVKLTPGSCWDFSHTTAPIYVIAASSTPNAMGVWY